jgi:hypothetical protein
MQSLFVTNSTLYSLLETVHANQLKYDIPELAALVQRTISLEQDLIKAWSDLNSQIAILNGKLDQIIAQVTSPETGDFNPQTAVITPKE